jgi:hypothetical protein
MVVLRVAAAIREEVIPEALTTEAANKEAGITEALTTEALTAEGAIAAAAIKVAITGAGIITVDVITTAVPESTFSGSPIMLIPTITLIIIGPPGSTLNSLTGITVRICKHITPTSRVAPAAGRRLFPHRKTVKGSACLPCGPEIGQVKANNYNTADDNAPYNEFKYRAITQPFADVCR